MNIIKETYLLLNQYSEKYKGRNLAVGLIILAFIMPTTAFAYASWKNPLVSTEHQQLILVITDNWQVNNGNLYTFTKQNNNQKENQDQVWQKSASSILSTKVTVGKKGLAWGIGLHPKQQGVHKVEGDGKAPAGIFSLGNAFGYLDNILTGLTYQAMTKNDFCIDVKGSPYYNQLVNSSIVGEKAIKGSTEGMRRDIHYKGDQRYKKGIFVKHNEENIDAAGSCIFMHVWKDKGIPTSGCTAMTEQNMDSILAWLDTDKNPLYIALPMAQYQALKSQWFLPEIADY